MARTSHTSSKPVKIPFRMHPRVFSSLGADLVTNDVVAIIELVKNSYDAFAKWAKVKFRVDDISGGLYIEIEDNGEGMNRTIIENVWCVVATPYRMLNPVSKSGKKKRRVSGEKGLGRLSAARLGNRLEMITKSANEPCWQVNVNWSSLAQKDNLETCSAEIVEYTADPPFGEEGTLVRILDLNSAWDHSRWNELKEQLSRLVSPFAEVRDFGIWLTLPGEKVEPIEIEPPDFLSYPPYSIKGQIDNTGIAHCEYIYSTSKGVKKEKHVAKALWADTENNSNNKTTSKNGPTCGPFNFEIRAWDIDSNSLEEIAEHFENLNKRSIREDIRNYRGISVYRDGILVLPKSESARDWLGLDLRRVSRVGKRLSTNQIIGYAAISADYNPGLRDTSDRERLVDSTALMDFRKLLIGIVEVLEGKREQNRQEATHQEPPFKDLFAALSAKELIDEVSSIAQKDGNAREVLPLIEDFNTRLQETVGQIERRLIYYSRLASLGALTAIIVHEVRNQTMVLGRLHRTTRETINGDKASIEKLKADLQLAEQAIRSLERIADLFAPLASRTFGTRRRDSILEDIIQECFAMREQEMRVKKINTKCVSSHRITTVAIDPGELIAVLINLIDNSLYWLSEIKDRERRIEVHASHPSNSQRVKVEVHDSGPGIPDGYEERIFWPGITRKSEGLGMGLTVASEIVTQYGGKMYLIKPGSLGGASFGFDLPISKRAK